MMTKIVILLSIVWLQNTYKYFNGSSFIWVAKEDWDSSTFAVIGPKNSCHILDQSDA